jgi:hypothetical protein
MKASHSILAQGTASGEDIERDEVIDCPIVRSCGQTRISCPQATGRCAVTWRLVEDLGEPGVRPALWACIESIHGSMPGRGTSRIITPRKSTAMTVNVFAKRGMIW